MAQALKLLYLALPRHSSVQVNNQPHYFLNTMPERGGMKRTCEHLRKKQTASLFLSESPPFRKWVKCRVSHSALCVQPFQSPEHGGGMDGTIRDLWARGQQERGEEASTHYLHGPCKCWAKFGPSFPLPFGIITGVTRENDLLRCLISLLLGKYGLKLSIRLYVCSWLALGFPQQPSHGSREAAAMDIMSPSRSVNWLQGSCINLPLNT